MESFPTCLQVMQRYAYRLTVVIRMGKKLTSIVEHFQININKSQPFIA